jgi:Tol biopolymer transport system component/C-terminal processing protease CtpA/Prc
MLHISRILMAASSAAVIFPSGIAGIAPHTSDAALAGHTYGPAGVASFAEPGISPDGSEIAFVSAGDIWTVSANGGEARLLVSNEAAESRPLYSPDGKRIAFVSNRTGNGDIYVLTLATGSLLRITYDDMAWQLDSWSHDGKWLYMSSGRDDISGMSDEYRVHSDGGTPMPVAADRYAAEYWGALSPDGHTLAITARGVSRSQWWRKGHSHLDESEIDFVTDQRGVPTYKPVVAIGSKSGWPMWSPDGSSIYYVSDRTGAANLWQQTSNGNAAPRQLTKFTDGRVLWPSISTNGKAIVFERDFGIWKYDVATGSASAVQIALRGSPAATGMEHQTFSNDVRQFALSPDGKKIAFIVHGEIFAVSAKDGGAATRVTDTPGLESQISWAPDSRRLVYTSDRDGPQHLFMYDFGASKEAQLTRGTSVDISPSWSPDGKSIAFIRDAHEVRLLDPATRSDKLLATAALGRPPYLGRSDLVFSPDGRWIAYAPDVGPRNFADVEVVPVAGGTSKPVSFLANTSTSALAWSRDGSFMLISTGQRTETNQFARIDLVPHTPHFREDQFRDLFREESPRDNPAREQNPRSETPSAPDSTATNDSAATNGSARRGRSPKNVKPVTIDFDHIRDRLSLLPVQIDVSDVAISPDGKTALLTAGAGGETNLYTYPLDDLAQGARIPRQLTSTRARKSDAQWSPDGKEVFYLEGGRINHITVASRTSHALAVSAEMDIDFSQEKMEVFTQAWSYLRDNFFNPTMNGTNWNAIRAEYTPRIEGAETPAQMRRILSLLVGELNSSHSGIGARAAHGPSAGRVGLRFDRTEYETNGRFRVTSVVPLSPAAVSGIRVGDYVTSVDGTTLDGHSNLEQLLSYRIGRRTVFGVAASPSAKTRDVAVLPVNTGTEKGLLYRAWVEHNREYVDSASHGRLGYVHMYDMSANALQQLYVDLDAQNMTRDGVVIDVRNNNGGFVNVYAIDVLSRKPYLNMQSRDRPVTDARTQLGERALEKPTILVTNQHTLSDGEDFTQGYRTLKLGKVVGEPTAGWIIFTSSATLIDGTTVRLPSTRITGLDGKDMEMHPRPVDVDVLRPVGESYQHKDNQLDAAVATLLAQLDTKH